MKNKIYFIIAIAIISIALASCSKDTSNPVTTQTGTNTHSSYIVVLNDDSGPQVQGVVNYAQVTQTILESHNISNSNTTAIYDNVLHGFAATLTAAQVSELKNDPRIKFIEKDQQYIIDDWVMPTNQKDATILAQTTPWGITAVGGSVNATTNTGVAWIIDTGIDFTHPDLNVNTALSKSFITYSPDKASANDLNGHGTHCAGIIAGKNNIVGVVGVCAGATVIPVKVLDCDGCGMTSGVISGINYVANNLVKGKINVVNLSLGGSTSAALDAAVTALANAGAYIVIAAGNNKANTNNYSPARVNGTRIFTISAYDANYSFASFSNWKDPSIDYSAPGVSIYSTYKNGGYATMSGTSMSAPHVAGILLANNGIIHTNGTIKNDPDGIPDPIAVR
jgi:subtilisin family serine protease